MKSFLRDYLLNFAIALILLSAGNFMLGQIETAYYKYADLNNFYQNRGFIAFDVCEGDEHQSILSDRIVLGTGTGYPATVNKELYRIQNNMLIKVHEEQTSPFIQFSETGKTQRIQKLPTTLPAGEYKWILYIKLNVYGAIREVIPPIESNVFTINDCTL